MVQIDPNSDNLKHSPQQTVGPYVTLGLLSGKESKENDNNLLQYGGEGEEIIVRGHLFGSDGKPLFNAMVEIWQANSHGVYNHPVDSDKEGFDPNFVGFGRDITNETGQFEFKTLKPGVIIDSNHPEFKQAPNILVFIHASGVPYPLYTRIYFEDEDHDDNFMSKIPQDKVETLIAKKSEEDGETVYEIDLVLEGDADELALETKLDGEDVDDMPDASGKPVSYFFHFD